MKPVIGLTGSIAAGKSTVANVFGACGAMVIDSDKASHEVLQSEQVKKELVAWWGETILDDDGNVDRKAVAAVVFKNPDELKRLEGVIYPRIEMRRQEKITAAQKDPAVRAIVIDAPKLIEAGLDQICDV
ncbi:MAG: dephospho-CoA kinase, partial [Phycisphaerae bacterium]